VGRLLTITRVELLRFGRDRTNVFFVLVLPLLVVVLIGAQFGGSSETRLGVVTPDGDAAAEALVADLGALDEVAVERVASEDELVGRVEENLLAAGLVLPEGYGAALEAGTPTEVAFVGQAGPAAVSIRQVVDAAIAAQGSAPTAAVAVAAATGRPTDGLVPVARQVQSDLPRVEVTTTAVGGDELAREFAGMGQFDLGASTQLVLFTFLTAMTGGAGLIETRRLGIATRMVSTPTPVPLVLGGQALGRIAIALFQALYIAIATLLLFRVDWGDPVAAGAVIVLFSVVAGGAGMLIGALASNDAQTAGLGIGLGIGLAALGGSMMPLDFYPPVARQVAFLTPHAWANQAMADIVRRDGTLVDVLPELGVLAVFAVVVLGLATVRLHRVLVR
jgi:ABC-2 type transport system permease protein